MEWVERPKSSHPPASLPHPHPPPEQEEQRALSVERLRGNEWASGPLDPLLRELTRQYVDDRDLSIRLHNLFFVRPHPPPAHERLHAYASLAAVREPRTPLS